MNFLERQYIEGEKPSTSKLIRENNDIFEGWAETTKSDVQNFVLVGVRISSEGVKKKSFLEDRKSVV